MWFYYRTLTFGSWIFSIFFLEVSMFISMGRRNSSMPSLFLPWHLLLSDSWEASIHIPQLMCMVSFTVRLQIFSAMCEEYELWEIDAYFRCPVAPSRRFTLFWLTWPCFQLDCHYTFLEQKGSSSRITKQHNKLVHDISITLSYGHITCEAVYTHNHPQVLQISIFLSHYSSFTSLFKWIV